MTSRNTMKMDLSPARRRLVELMQRLNFGRLEGLRVRNGEPFFDPPPRVIRSVKLGGDNGLRREASKEDFSIKAKVIELFDILDQIGNGVIERIDIAEGLPCSMTYQEDAA